MDPGFSPWQKAGFLSFHLLLFLPGPSEPRLSLDVSATEEAAGLVDVWRAFSFNVAVHMNVPTVCLCETCEAQAVLSARWGSVTCVPRLKPGMLADAFRI